MPRIRVRRRAAKRKVRWGARPRRAPPQCVLHADFNRFSGELRDLSGSARSLVLGRWWGRLFPDEPLPGREVWDALKEMRIGYELLVRAYKRERAEVPPKVLSRWKASRRMRVDAYDEAIKAVLGAAWSGREKRMARAKSTKKAAAAKSGLSKGESQAAIALDVFSRKRPQKYADVVAEFTKRAKPGAKVESNLGWYVSAFNAGKLTGQGSAPSKPFAFADGGKAARKAKAAGGKATGKKAGRKKAAGKKKGARKKSGVRRASGG